MEPLSRDVFLSYKTEDREAAERLCATLERAVISCWLAPRDIPPGQEWAAAIVDGLQKSKTFVLLLSGHSVAAKQVAREAELADRQNLPIITFRIEDVQPPKELLYYLGNIQWLDAFGGRFDAAAQRLMEVVRGSASNPAPTPPPAQSVGSQGAAASQAPQYPPAPNFAPPQIPLPTPQFFVGRWRGEAGNDLMYLPNGTFSGVIMQNVGGFPVPVNAFGQWNLQILGPGLFQLQLWFANMATWAGTFRVLDGNRVQNLETNQIAFRVG